MNSQITEVFNVTSGTAWLPLAVQYFFLIGLSHGGFVLTLPYFVFGRVQHERLGRLALLGALLCRLTAPVALLADLHGPGQSYHFCTTAHASMDAGKAGAAVGFKAIAGQYRRLR
jgi:tetrathionate reductase subunit C